MDEVDLVPLMASSILGHLIRQDSDESSRLHGRRGTDEELVHRSVDLAIKIYHRAQDKFIGNFISENKE
jgi:hypothetical protein